MTRTALVVLVAALAACGKPPPPAAPTPNAIGAELATFRQFLVPISSGTWVKMNEAAALGHSVVPNLYPQPYAHASVLVNGSSTAVIFAFTGVWLVPLGVPLQPMSVQQFLRAFASDAETNLASVIDAARAAGASSEDLPFTVLLGSRR